MIKLFFHHPAVLFHGFLLRLLSAVGQTFFVSLLMPELQGRLQAGPLLLGGLYSLATLISSALILWSGPWMDRYSMRSFSLLATFILILSCLSISQSFSVAGIFWGFLGLRFGGQGLLAQIATLKLSRHFHPSRGKALAFSAIGHPLGEATFPGLFLATVQAFGFSDTLLGLSAFFLIVFLPLNLLLLKSYTPQETATDSEQNAIGTSRREVISEARFRNLLPGMLTPALVLTGVFFHSTAILREYNLPTEAIATGFACFAALRLACSLAIGPLIDRFSARRWMPFYLIPLAIGFILMVSLQNKAGYLAFMGLAGATIGMNSTLITAFLAQVYGTANLGALRSMMTSMAIFGTSVSPILFGYLLQQGIGFQSIFQFCFAYATFGILLNIKALRQYPSPTQ